MKKEILCAIIVSFVSSYNIFAQTSEYTHFTDSLFQHLNKTEITTGILYDRVFPVTSLHSFNRNYADTSSNSYFIQAYKEMYRAAYNNSSWIAPEDVKTIAISKKYDAYKEIPVGLAHYSFNVIDTNSIESGLIQQIDSMYYDVHNRPFSPYQLINTFVASPLLDSITLDSGTTVLYNFSPELTFNKSAATLSALTVDFDDGSGPVAITLNTNSNVAVNYYSTGYKTLKFTAGFSDSTTAVTYAVIKVKTLDIIWERPGSSSLSNCDVQGYLTIWSQLAFQGYDEATASNGRGDVKIYYATDGACDGILRKPIIVVDGFDPGDERDAKNLYDTYLNNQSRGKLGDNLRAVGYDIIVLNFPKYTVGTRTITLPIIGNYTINIERDGGADYIERNARVLMALINHVNTTKSGNEKLVVIGPSMGGLISRYALAYMEQNNMLHQTRLWLSFDSPHKGANIPLGDQEFLNYYADSSPQVENNLNEKINSVAAKQMLVHHYLANSASRRELRDSMTGFIMI